MKRRNFIKGLLGISGAAVAGVKIDGSSLPEKPSTPDGQWDFAKHPPQGRPRYEFDRCSPVGPFGKDELDEILRPAAQKIVNQLEIDLARHMLG